MGQVLDDFERELARHAQDCAGRPRIEIGGRKGGGGAFRSVRHTKYDTYVSKLTLSVEDVVVKRAKRYAARRGTSVSQLVEQYLDLVSRPAPTKGEELTPLLRRLRGELKGVSVDVAGYHRYLERKYR